MKGGFYSLNHTCPVKLVIIVAIVIAGNPYKITSPYGLVMTPMDISSKCTQLSTATIFLPDSCEFEQYLSMKFWTCHIQIVSISP